MLAHADAALISNLIEPNQIKTNQIKSNRGPRKTSLILMRCGGLSIQTMGGIMVRLRGSGQRRRRRRQQQQQQQQQAMAQRCGESLDRGRETAAKPKNNHRNPVDPTNRFERLPALREALRKAL
jgi:hypothetical protein